MDIQEIRSKAKVLEDSIWKLIYDFEQETTACVKDISISRITNIGERKGALHTIYTDIKLW